ncbi:MAG: plasmid pRiA4b ORF-3 family protein [Clostridiales bacterium]|nr:plasmid pRiA4b ORF-3 family protein [Clostridiales bacterium]
MISAIRNTMLAMNIDPEVVDEYMSRAAEPEFYSNNDPKLTAALNSTALQSAFIVGRTVNDSEGIIKYDDTMGQIVSRYLVNYSKNYKDGFVPAEEMIKALAEFTGKPVYKYRAFEIVVSLDLDIYTAVRRLIVPAGITFFCLHELLQRVFDWRNCHLHDFNVLDEKGRNSVARIVACTDDLEYGGEAALERDLRLSAYFPKYNHIIYMYDMGDNWEHNIELVRVMEDYGEDSPYLLEAIGQTPPEDVGGVPGFIEFREIMLDPKHPDHAKTKEWARYWPPELSEWEARPKIIHL